MCVAPRDVSLGAASACLLFPERSTAEDVSLG